MRVAVTLSPTGDWPAIMQAAQLADRAGLDAVGFWDHYHAERPEWAYICGWAAYGALATTTTRIHLLPMVLCRLNYTTGVLAKETSVLSIISGGRFELGIGAGDYPAEFTAWHQPFPDAPARIAALEETVAALRLVWRGEAVTYTGNHVQLTDAACTPAPPAPPRVVVGVGGSRRLIQSAVTYADEINCYADENLLKHVHAAISRSGRSVAISIFLHWDQWPPDVRGELTRWADRDVDRAVVNIGYDANLAQRVAELAEAWQP
jgi:alkanesulfonate monooxygenase SsuD/methylene tetrahydromethanopterin reductase-like flavin-dependent oxidoreductase (luciferase family)